jgi:hypothetical protein
MNTVETINVLRDTLQGVYNSADNLNDYLSEAMQLADDIDNDEIEENEHKVDTLRDSFDEAKDIITEHVNQDLFYMRRNIFSVEDVDQIKRMRLNIKSCHMLHSEDNVFFVDSNRKFLDESELLYRYMLKNSYSIHNLEDEEVYSIFIDWLKSETFQISEVNDLRVPPKKAESAPIERGHLKLVQ